MNNLRTALERLKFDIRMIDLNVKKKNLTRPEIDKRLTSLPDEKDKSTKIEFTGESSN